ncbi:MAG TPA: DUF502 domain-containing protein [Vicinamibacterales bacterium]|nr:DUF502 domain-containing protein [Vicinamibacterales bacterium]
MLQWLRRSFIAGFFIAVPIVVSVAAFVWMFRLIDGWTAHLWVRLLGREVPGLGIATTAAVLLAIGALATNVFGRRILQTGEYYLLRVPLFRTVYSPVKQLVVAFSPDNESGFKRVALVEHASGGQMLGFLTREFTIDRGAGPEPVVAVYVPTNHLYLGDVVVLPLDRVSFPDLTVEQGIRVFLTGGMALPPRMTAHRGADGRDSYRV